MHCIPPFSCILNQGQSFMDSEAFIIWGSIQKLPLKNFQKLNFLLDLFLDLRRELI